MSPQQIWQAQLAGAQPVTLEYVRDRASTLSKATKARQWRVLALGTLFSIPVIGNLFHLYGGMPIHLASVIYLYAAMWAGLAFWVKRTKAAPMPADAGLVGSLQFYKRELERQRDAANNRFARRVLLPLPGLVGLYSSFLLEHHPVPWGLMAVTGIVVVAAFAFGPFARRALRRHYQKEIDAVDRLLR